MDELGSEMESVRNITPRGGERNYISKVLRVCMCVVTKIVLFLHQEYISVFMKAPGIQLLFRTGGKVGESELKPLITC